MKKMTKLISVVIAVFNEERNIQLLYEKICGIFNSLKNYDYEIIFVNDGSEDDTYNLIVQIAKSDNAIKLIDLSRNFGNQIALSAGLDYAKGAAIITMDGDLQHPPSLIRKLLIKWEEGFEIVIGERLYDEDIRGFRKIASKCYFWFLKRISDISLEAKISDFRLLDRKVVDALTKFRERNRFLRGLVHWVGYKRDYVTFHVDSRNQGFSKFSFVKLIRLGLQGITGFSLFPLRLAGYLGLGITFVSLLLLGYMSCTYFFGNPHNIRPIAFFAVLNSLLSGFTLVCLGLIALYIGNTYHEVLRRPLYIVREKLNIDENS